MNKKDHEPAPGDGLRSLKSTTLFRAINYELYARQVRIFLKVYVRR